MMDCVNAVTGAEVVVDSSNDDGDSIDSDSSEESFVFEEPPESNPTAKLRSSERNWELDVLKLVSKGMPHMRLSKRDKGATHDKLRYKSLLDRWYSVGKKANAERTEESNGEVLIERGTVLTLKKNKTELHVVCGIYSKYNNKWFLSDLEKGIDLKGKTPHKL